MLKTFVTQFRCICEKRTNPNFITKRFAGHSKWQNIKHIKSQKDAQRSQLFTKLGRMMKVAVAENGGSVDPMSNLRLSQVIDQAKRSNMPVASIQSVLKSCQVDKSQAQSRLIEIKGPGSCFILCEVFTPNFHTLKQNVAAILKKHKSKFSDGVIHMFEEKGIIEVAIEEIKNEQELLETATDNAIVSGAEDVKLIDNNILQFSCGKSNFSQVVKELENVGYKITNASIEYIPFKLQSLQDSDLDVCKDLYEKLEALPDVIRISDNIA